MLVLLAVLVGVLFGAATYAMLRRGIVDLVFGLVLLGHASNLLVFATGGLMRGHPPIASPDATVVADPLPQAMVLTAIVIGFGLVAFQMVLLVQLDQVAGTDDEETIEGWDP